MPKYLVTLPIAGAISVEVEADDKTDAVEAALAVEWSVQLSECVENVEIIELETFRRIVTGNVCHAPYRELDVEPIED